MERPGALLARRTRTIRMCSFDARVKGSLTTPFQRGEERIRRTSSGLVTRFGVPVGGRVRKLGAVKDQSAPIPGEKTSEL